jgi:hypothetical protein
LGEYEVDRGIFDRPCVPGGAVSHQPTIAKIGTRIGNRGSDQLEPTGVKRGFQPSRSQKIWKGVGRQRRLDERKFRLIRYRRPASKKRYQFVQDLRTLTA